MPMYSVRMSLRDTIIEETVLEQDSIKAAREAVKRHTPTAIEATLAEPQLELPQGDESTVEWQEGFAARIAEAALSGDPYTFGPEEEADPEASAEVLRRSELWIAGWKAADGAAGEDDQGGRVSDDDPAPVVPAGMGHDPLSG